MRAIVTGANTGLGYQTALGLVRRGAEVTLAVRNHDRGQAAADRIRAAVPHARITVSLLDLRRLADVDAFVARERDRGPLDVLVNNAGVMLVPRREFTDDGFEMHMGVNHLGHVALTLGLLLAISAAPAGRIVSVSSLAHWSAGRLDRSLNTAGRYRPMRAYGQSKLAMLLFAAELDRRLRAAASPAVSLAAHPGWSATELTERNDRPNLFVRLSRASTQWLGSTPADGARPQLAAALEPNPTGGDYLGPSWLMRGAPHRCGRSRAARNRADAEWLWQRSAELTGHDPAILG